jgi:hypothetical protein
MEKNGGEGERQELSAPHRRRRPWRGGGRQRTGERLADLTRKSDSLFSSLAADKAGERDKAGQRVDRESSR